MEADRTAPVYGTGDIEVAADPEAIGGVLGDIGSWPAWTPDITGATLQGPVPGTTFRWKSGPGTITSTFQVVDGPTKLTWTGKTMAIPAIHTTLKTAIDTGLARLKAEAERRGTR